jgi:hypothetical protein
VREEPEVEIGVHVGQAVHGERDDERPGNNQIFGLDLGRQTADDEHHDHGDEAAGRQHESGPRGRVAEILLHQLEQELRGREQDRPAIRTSITGSRRVISHGIMSTKARAQAAATLTMKVEPNQSS